MESKLPTGSVVWINGFPGVGKLTIARELVKLLGDDASLIDNHQLIDQVTIPRDHPDYNSQRRQVRQAAIAEHVLSAATATADNKDTDPYNEREKEYHENKKRMKKKVVVFTDFQSDNKLGRGVAWEYRDAAAAAGWGFLPVYVGCEREENVRRVGGAERVGRGKGKLVDARVLRRFLDGCELFRFVDGDDGYGVGGLEVDVTVRTPGDVAEQILGRVLTLGGL